MAALALGLTLALASGAQGLKFTHPMKLRNSPPKGNLQGGEPSVAFDRNGRWVYVVAPGGGQNGGVGFWRSHTRGRHFSRGKSLGSFNGGFDADVDVGRDHTVYVADLEITANALCRSHNHGKHFDSGCDTGIASNQTGVESDREWVNPSPRKRRLVYFSYHDISTETPLVYVSHQKGDPGTFAPCGPVLAPGSEAEQNYVPGGTNQGKLLVSRDNSLYVPILEPTNPATLDSDYNNFYMAIARHGCDGSTIFDDVKVYSNPKANLANIFPYVTEDGRGNIYAAFIGISGRDGHHSGVYLLVSHSRGKQWRGPIRVDPRKSKAAALGSLTAGPHAGDVALGFYSTRSTHDPNAHKNRWKFDVAVSRTGGHRFRRDVVTRHPIHYGQICNKGILCTGGRNLLDFSSIEVNPRTGCVLTVFAGDPYDKPKNNRHAEAAPYVSRQKHHCF